MSKSVLDISKEMITLYGTKDNAFDDFPIGTEVKVVTAGEDFYFFFGETGKVTKNSGSYLGICVEFHEPRIFVDGSVQKNFNFNPKSICILNDVTRAIAKDQKRLKLLSKEEKAKEEENKKRSVRFEIMDL